MRLRMTTALFFGLALAGGWAVLAESRALPGPDGLPRGPGLGLKGTRAALLACTEALMPPRARLQPAAERARRSAVCGRIAGQVLRRMPSHGLAYLVQALAADSRGDTAERARALALSARFSPREGWLAEHRFLLAAQAGASAAAGPAGDGGAGVRPLPAWIGGDLDTLLTTQSGAELLARYLLRRPASRAAILAATDRAAPADRLRMRNILRSGKALR